MLVEQNGPDGDDKGGRGDDVDRRHDRGRATLQAGLEQHKPGRHRDSEHVKVGRDEKVPNRADEAVALDEGRSRLEAEPGHAVEEPGGHSEQRRAQPLEASSQAVSPVRHLEQRQSDHRRRYRSEHEVGQVRRAAGVIDTGVDRQAQQHEGEDDQREGEPLHPLEAVVEDEM
ncbi:MAG: hypothetical protein ABSD85_14575 [Acidimicrobiales bacterium]